MYKEGKIKPYDEHPFYVKKTATSPLQKDEAAEASNPIKNQKKELKKERPGIVFSVSPDKSISANSKELNKLTGNFVSDFAQETDRRDDTMCVSRN